MNILSENIVDDESESECTENNSNQESNNESEIILDSVVNETDKNFGKCNNYVINFHDVEALIKPFDGLSSMSILKWISEFEDMSKLFKLTGLQKLIFAKRLIIGRAKLFLEGESNVRSWEKIRSALMKEFSMSKNSADVHANLANRKQGDNETVVDYFYSMKEIASESNVEDDAVTQYIINGINDLEVNKHILYGSRNITEFREKLKVYEKIKSNSKKPFSTVKDFKNFKNMPKQEVSRDMKYGNKNKTDAPNSVGTRHKNDFYSKIICYNCNEEGHRSSVCKYKEKGLRCFKCNNFGHKANVCTTDQKKVNKVTVANTGPNKIKKSVDVRGKTLDAIWDTGSEITMIQYDTYVTLGSPTLNKSNVSLLGIGSSQISPVGHFSENLIIDNCSVNTNVYVLNDLCSDMIIGMDVMSQLNFSICNENVSIQGKRENFKVNYVRISHSNQHDNDILPEKEIDEFIVQLANAVVTDVIDLSHVTNLENKTEIQNLIECYTPVITKKSDFQMRIILNDESPVSLPPRRFGFAEKKIIEDQIQTWLKEGIVQNSCSDYAAPVVLTKKKNNSHRLCIDYRKLNKKIIKDKFPLPLIEDVLDQLENSKVFTSLDLKNGFFHVDIEEKSRKYTAFVTHNGQYEFLKCPFGLCTSPNVFMRFVYNVFRDLIHDNTVLVYLDDIIIPSENEEEGIKKLKRVLKVAAENGLELNFKKCQFLKSKIEFLGYIIENGTIQPSPSKTLAVQKYPIPKSIKQVQSFLGLTGYFRKFIPQYSLIAKPLSDLLRKGNEFNFGPEQLEAFNKLKDILSQKPVLHIFQQGLPLELHTDASSHGFGSVLLMKADDGNLHPIQYMSKKTTPQQEKYCSYELEVLAIIESLKKFRNYLLGSKVKIVTDCSAFQKTLDKKELAPKVARWALFLEEFEYEIVHRPGNLMKHVDALSRNTVLLVTRSQDEMTTKIISAQNEDEHLKLIKSLVEKGEKDNYFLRNDVLYKFENGRDLLVVPEALQNEIIKKIHKKGHFATAKTEKILEQEFFIPKVKNKIESVIANCLECILYNRKQGKGEGFLNPIPKENSPLSTYHIDFIGPLPSTNKRYQHIFTIVDAFTKFTWFYPVKSTSTEEAIDRLKLQQTVFGNPSRIISDRGAAFRAKEFELYCTEEGIEHVKITTGIPRGNGQIERIHRILIPVLSKLSQEDPTKWYKFVSGVQRIINSTPTRSTKFSPFELMIGTKMKNKEDVKIIEILNEEYENQLQQDRDDMRNEAKSNILKLQEENKKQFNKKRKKPQLYKLNDLVAVQRTQFGTGLKLRPKFYGPYKITAVKTNDRYDVEKVGSHEGPFHTSTAADHMKPWSNEL